MDIPISKPYLTRKDKNAILEPINDGWLVQGSKVQLFEKKFADFTNAAFAVATSNCTTALHLALIALNIQKGDKVIVPSFTYVASANAVEYTGATPIFCDIDLRTFNIDVNKIVSIIEKEKGIKAIMPVHLFGLCADMEEIMNIAREYCFKVVEDCACGFDAWVSKKHSGTFGDCGCFSFHPRKSITTGEGGMLITNDAMVAENVKLLRDHGANKSDLHRHHSKNGSLLPEFNVLGYNYRLTDIQGALGVAQMSQAKEIMDKRRDIVKIYQQELSEISKLLTPFVPDGYTHGYQSYVCLFGGDIALQTQDKNIIESLNWQRNIFMKKLESRGISTRQGTHAVHTLGYYRNKYSLCDYDYLQSYKADRLSIAFPLYPQMSQIELEYVIHTIKECI